MMAWLVKQCMGFEWDEHKNAGNIAKHGFDLMSGVEREITLDIRHVAKHLVGTAPTDRLLRQGRAAHVFNDETTLVRVAQAIIKEGEYTGFARGYERYGLFFLEPIGVRISPNGSTIPLFYGEVKINANNQYHPIPRTKPSEG